MKSRNPDIDHYFNYRHYMYLASNSHALLDKEPERITNLIENNFSIIEIYIFEEYLIKKRSLKSISIDLGYSYSYTRQIIFRARKKFNRLLLIS